MHLAAVILSVAAAAADEESCSTYELVEPLDETAVRSLPRDKDAYWFNGLWAGDDGDCELHPVSGTQILIEDGLMHDRCNICAIQSVSFREPDGLLVESTCSIAGRAAYTQSVRFDRLDGKLRYVLDAKMQDLSKQILSRCAQSSRSGD